jgi:hypothetical protein
LRPADGIEEVAARKKIEVKAEAETEIKVEKRRTWLYVPNP